MGLLSASSLDGASLNILVIKEIPKTTLQFSNSLEGLTELRNKAVIQLYFIIVEEYKLKSSVGKDS